MDALRLKHDAIARAELVARDVQESWDGGPDGEAVCNIAVVERRVRAHAAARGFHDERTVELAYLALTGEELL